MKRILVLFVLVILIKHSSFSQETPESMVDNFFSYFNGDNTLQAIDYLISVGPNLKSDSSLSVRLNRNLQTAYTNNGVYCGYELVEKEKVSDSYYIYTYFIKYLKNPVKIHFVFYRHKDKWFVNSVNLIRQTNEDEGRGQEKRNMSQNPNNKNVNKQKSNPNNHK
jgi:hypothetical protein